MKFLITGESGMLAKSIIYNLGLKNIADNFKKEYFNKYHYFNNKLVKGYELDITDRPLILSLRDTLDSNSIIIHTAAYVNTDKCLDDPFSASKVNVTGTQNIIELAKLTGSKLIYFSTSAVFDPDEYMKSYGIFDESCKIDPKTLYGITKYQGELAVKQSLENYVIIKPVFIYGDAPFDNSSQIRKILERGQRIKNGEKFNSKLKVTLSRDYKKNYMRCEYFSMMLSEMLLNIDKAIGEDFIMGRDAEFAKPFQHYLDIISSELDMDVDDFIELLEEEDYLKDHLGSSLKFYETFNIKSKFGNDDRSGINKTHMSIKSIFRI